MSSNNENFNSPNPLTCVRAITPEFGISPVSSLSMNLGSNLNIRRNLVFNSNNDSASTKMESDENATATPCSPTSRMLKHAKLSAGGGGGGGSPSNGGGARFLFTPTDKENGRRSYSMDYSSMSDNEVSPSKFAITKQMCVRERYPLEDQDPNSQDSGFSDDSKLSFQRGLRRSLTENTTPSRIVVRSSVEPDFSELMLMPLKRTAPEEEPNVFLKRRKASTKLTSTTSMDSAFSPTVSPPEVVSVPTTSTLRKTLFDYGFQKTSVKFQRSFSESAATIAKAIEQSTLNPNLIGDCSRPFALPLKMGKHADQRNIDCHTLAKLIRGDYDDKVASFTIIDCRYPYEYDAGHIKGAINIHTPEKIKEELIVKKSLRDFHQCIDPKKHNILIFHCEFSSERGPSLSRYLRKVDRDHYGVQFPKLDYPEIYLLDGGYSEFYRHYKELCDPCFYQKMIDFRYANEMSQGNKERTMFSRSKSWATTDDSNQPKPRNTTFKRLVL